MLKKYYLGRFFWVPILFTGEVSCAKWKVDEFLIAKLRSLIKIKKSKGPKTDPCGTPHSIFR